MQMGFSTVVFGDFDEVAERTRVSLKEAGFGIVSEIDMRKTFREKLGIEFRNYLILGACNPELARRALDVTSEVGLVMPCNVTVEATDEGIKVTAVNPVVMLGPMSTDAAIRAVADDATPRLKQAIDSLT
jgi:uncharacterized protein (DUF302 family)